MEDGAHGMVPHRFVEDGASWRVFASPLKNNVNNSINNNKKKVSSGMSRKNWRVLRVLRVSDSLPAASRLLPYGPVV